MTEKKCKVFVYGTLKRGHGNHSLLAGARFLGRTWTCREYALYSAGIPFVVKNERVSRIQGELYLVDEATLEALDRLEGHPDWYRREETQVTLEGESRPVTAWLYFHPHPAGTLLPEGIY